MKQVNLLLEDDEMMILRAQARLMAMMPEVFGEEELVEKFITKILQATDRIDGEYKKEIGDMQRSLRALKATPHYSMLLSSMQSFSHLMVSEIEKQNPPA